LENNVPIERIGIYFAKPFFESIRLSIEGVQILKDQITRNIIELNNEDATTWMYGSEVQIETGKKCLVIIKHKDYFLGCGKASEKKISNFIPKSRRLRDKSIIK
jgi:NOL1/NOP2/fmu family ribosome biogenesis protein